MRTKETLFARAIASEAGCKLRGDILVKNRRDAKGDAV